MHSWFSKLQRFLGIEREQVSWTEKTVSALGGCLGILFVSYISLIFIGTADTAWLMPSMGASAVLLFAVPHGRLSQPWPLIGGHMVSAFVGVCCYQLIHSPLLAAAVAVGLAIGVMHLLGCIHPPGGATALIAVIGGPAIHDLGFYFVVTPILLNTIAIFIVAVIFNGLFPWRRYPVSIMRFTDAPIAGQTSTSRLIDKNCIEQALTDMDLIVDITIDDLQRLFTLTLAHAEDSRMTAGQILLGHYYSNGKHGGEWSVRQIIDESRSEIPARDMVIYRVAEGHGVSSTGSCTRSEFACWAMREVFLNTERPDGDG